MEHDLQKIEEQQNSQLSNLGTLIVLIGVLSVLFLVCLFIIGLFASVEHVRNYYGIPFTISSLGLLIGGTYFINEVTKEPNVPRRILSVYTPLVYGSGLYVCSLVLTLIQKIAFGYSVNEGINPFLDVCLVLGVGLMGLSVLAQLFVKRKVDDNIGGSITLFVLSLLVIYVILLILGFVYPESYLREHFSFLFVCISIPLMLTPIVAGIALSINDIKNEESESPKAIDIGISIFMVSIIALVSIFLIALVHKVTFGYGMDEGLLPFLSAATLIFLIIPFLNHVVLVAFAIFTKGYRKRITPFRLFLSLAYVALVIAVIIFRAWYKA
ncbi:hypothetical protein ACFYKX_08645 [Cytobacillus sp. FJAT-54145]|uniref:Uncharacterized protein n=1 Tax=Cytobacillus spartinae TaxID=3299023 RepID=A0ABW6K8Z5_9BACI